MLKMHLHMNNVTSEIVWHEGLFYIEKHQRPSSTRNGRRSSARARARPARQRAHQYHIDIGHYDDARRHS